MVTRGLESISASCVALDFRCEGLSCVYPALAAYVCHCGAAVRALRHSECAPELARSLRLTSRQLANMQTGVYKFVQRIVGLRSLLSVCVCTASLVRRPTNEPCE